jgi:hypothetical protein
MLEFAMRIVLACVLVSGCGGDDGMEMAADASTSADPSTGLSSDDSSTAIDGSSSSGEPLPEVDYETDIQPLFNANCTCHLQGASGMMTAPFMTLNPGMSHAQLVGVAAEQTDLDRVTPNDLEASYLWHKLQGTHMDVGGTGTRMPATGPLPDEELELVRAWILQGALP